MLNICFFYLFLSEIVLVSGFLCFITITYALHCVHRKLVIFPFVCPPDPVLRFFSTCTLNHSNLGHLHHQLTHSAIDLTVIQEQLYTSPTSPPFPPFYHILPAVAVSCTSSQPEMNYIPITLSSSPTDRIDLSSNEDSSSESGLTD